MDLRGSCSRARANLCRVYHGVDGTRMLLEHTIIVLMKTLSVILFVMRWRQCTPPTGKETRRKTHDEHKGARSNC